MKLKFYTKLFYGLGESPNTISKVMMSMLFMFFLTDVVGLEPALAGLIFMIGRCWDAFSDPLVGMLSDRTNTRWGRRRPFMILAAIPLGLSFFSMWYPYAVDSQIVKMILYTTAYVTYMTCITCYHVPYISLFPEMTDDYNERTSIQNYRQFFASAIGLAAAVLPKMVVDSFDDKALGFLVTVGPASILIALVPFLVTSIIKERPVEISKSEKTSILKNFQYAFKNRSFVSLFFIFMGCWAAVSVIESFIVYYMKYWMMNEKQMPLVFVAVVLASLISLPLWSFLTKKIGKKKTTIVGLSMWAIPQLFWLALTPDTNFSLVLVVGAMVGFGYGGAHIFSWAIFPDVMDEFEVETGKRNDGLYSGVLFFTQKLAHSISMFAIGLILQWVGYVPNAPQNGTALEAMRFIMCFGPFIYIVIGIVAALFFPITMKRYKEIRVNLDAKKAKQMV